MDNFSKTFRENKVRRKGALIIAREDIEDNGEGDNGEVEDEENVLIEEDEIEACGPVADESLFAEQLTSREELIRQALRNPLLIQRELCRRDLSEFIRYFFSSVAHDELKWNWHIDYLAEQLMNLAERVGRMETKDHDLIFNVPPGTTKSITCSIMFPVWCWTRWPWMRFITASYSNALSLEHADYSRELIRCQKFRELFPELGIKEDKDTKSNFRIRYLDGEGRQHLGGNRYSTSVGGTLTGFHGHILIVDDPINPREAVSSVKIQAANHWMEQTLSTRKVDKAVTPTVLIMQRLHEDDPTGHLLAKKKENILHVSLPGETRHFGKFVRPIELITNYTNDLLDPNRMPWSVLEDMQADLGQYGYAGQVGQNPVPPGGGMFKPDYFSIVDNLPTPANVGQVIRYWDKAGTKDAGAFTCGVKMAKLRTGKLVVIDVKRGQWASEERENIIRQTAEADGTSVIIYHEQEPGSGGKDSAQSTIRNLIGFSNYADRPTGDKIRRADPYSVQVNNGNVLLLRGDWNSKFIEEHRFFPFGRYKDQVDAASGAFTKLVQKRIVQRVV